VRTRTCQRRSTSKSARFTGAPYWVFSNAATSTCTSLRTETSRATSRDRTPSGPWISRTSSASRAATSSTWRSVDRSRVYFTASRTSFNTTPICTRVRQHWFSSARNNRAGKQATLDFSEIKTQVGFRDQVSPDVTLDVISSVSFLLYDWVVARQLFRIDASISSVDLKDQSTHQKIRNYYS